jgi:hypothetical protein
MALTPIRPIRLIAFVGKAGSGKTTAAKCIERMGYSRLSFADALKKMLYEGLEIPHEYLYGNKKSELCEELCGRTARHAMITLGTEWGRDMIHPDIWVNATSRKLGQLISMGGNRFVIDDIRFLNEAKWINGLNDIGVIARIVRISRNEGNGEVTQHRSETEQDGIIADWDIRNNSTLDSLYKSIDEVLTYLFKKEN